MHGNILPALPGQAVTSLSDLAKAIRAEHAAVVSAFSSAAEHAIKCGKILAEAKKQTGHGRWTEFVRTCGIGDRTARQYMQLADLAEQNRARGTDLAGQNGTGGTDLAGMTIKGAIRYLAPPKSAKPATAPKQIVGPKPPAGGKPTKHIDILGAWMTAPAADRAKAIDSIGLNALLAAIPEDWWVLIAKRLAERSAPPSVATFDPALLPADGSIPPCLLRRKGKKPKPQDDVAASAELMKTKFAALEMRAAS